ncbi:Fumarate reductase 2 [Pleurostoma richardsiae]|uniref:Fumarate reductase 2 n=1 Tax=Pleurostoma richardsiae TaxID=41990 RepID=A0AA38RXH1_9PEZI|nr:Fumarate reductase 2 [Pleurostoma richardsiae]
MTRRSLLLTLVLTALIPLTAVLYRRIQAGASLAGLFPSQSHPQAGTMAPQPPAPPAAAVIVVGAGLAGLSAAHAALRLGCPVRLLERAPKPGGNSIKASSGINGAPTRFQPGYPDRPDTTFYADTVRSAGGRLSSPPAGAGAARAEREALISILTGRSAAAVEDFLAGEIGVDLSVVAQLGGHSAARTHRGAGKTPPGAAIVSALLEKLKADSRFGLELGAEVTHLLTAESESGAGQRPAAVTGVEYTTTSSGGDSSDSGSKETTTHRLLGPVVFATGGFAGDTHGQLAHYRADLAGLPSTNDARPGTHGLLRRDAAAALVDMDSVQVHPTGFVDPADPRARVKFLAAEMLRGEGGILLSGGRRFVNEMETREHVSGVVMALPTADDDDGAGGGAAGEDELRQWDVQLLLDPGACEAAAAHVGFYLWKGLITKKKVRELDETTRQTIREYADVVQGKKEDEFGRKVFGHWSLKGTAEDDDQEVCVGRVTPITHFTMGGVVMNEKAQVMASDLGSSDPRPIDGLWAAGEVTGGIHGDNRLGGSSLLECVVYGRIAGEQASRRLIELKTE